MEFNIEKNKVVGIINQKRGKESAQIKVVGYIDSNKKCIRFQEFELLTLFPPKGFVFEPGFFINYHHFKEGDMIYFNIGLNEMDAKPGDDIYRLRVDNSNRLNLYWIRVFEIVNFKMDNLSIDFTTARILENESSCSFYGFSKDKIYGKLKMLNGRIEPAKSLDIGIWDKNDCDFYEYNDKIYLLSEPTIGSCSLLDTMDEKALFKWFKKKIELTNSKNKDIVSILNNETKWTTEIPNIFANSENNTRSIEKIRFDRVERNFHNYDLLVSDIKELAETSDNLREVFQSCIERQKEELRKEYITDIEEFKSKNESDKQKLELQLTKINSDIEIKKSQLNNLNEELNLFNTKIDQINANKDRILSDFSIIQEVLGTKVLKVNTNDNLDSFIIETIDKQEYAQSITAIDKFIIRCKYFLSNYNINPKISRKLLKLIASYKGMFISDISIAIAIAEATGNAKYIIQQAEPDWLHFKDFWENGLGAIWESSHQNPEQFHFIILEDMNLASPECYARPLLDCMNGIRKQIPYGKTRYPKNLKIFATKISSNEPQIGLPLFEKTFKNWGAFGFSNEVNLDEKSEIAHPFIEGFLDVETLNFFKPDELDLIDLKTEFTNLFDTV